MDYLQDLGMQNVHSFEHDLGGYLHDRVSSLFQHIRLPLPFLPGGYCKSRVRARVAAVHADIDLEQGGACYTSKSCLRDGFSGMELQVM